MRLSRRKAIWLLTAGVGVGGFAGFAWLRAAAPGFRVLAAGEVKTVESLLTALFSLETGAPVDPLQCGALEEVDRLLAEDLPSEVVAPFRYLLHGLEAGTAVSRGRPFSSLSDTERLDVLNVWSGNEPFPRRLALDSLKSILGMAYWSQPEVLEAIGWTSPCWSGRI